MTFFISFLGSSPKESLFMFIMTTQFSIYPGRNIFFFRYSIRNILAVHNTSMSNKSLCVFFIDEYFYVSMTIQGLKFLSLPWQYTKPVF